MSRFEDEDRAAQEAPLGPSSVSDVRRIYPDAAVFGYLIFAVGVVAAFLAVALSLSDSAAGLHSSAMALGIIGAGLFGNRLDRWGGPRRIHYFAVAALLVAIGLLVSAVTFAATLLGAALVGFGAGTILAHANPVLSAGGGSLARLRLARASLIATISSLSVPLFIELGASSGLGWQVVVVPALILLVVALVLIRGREFVPPSRNKGSGSVWIAARLQADA
jgi:MFS family permease